MIIDSGKSPWRITKEKIEVFQKSNHKEADIRLLFLETMSNSPAVISAKDRIHVFTSNLCFSLKRRFISWQCIWRMILISLLRSIGLPTISVEKCLTFSPVACYHLLWHRIKKLNFRKAHVFKKVHSDSFICPLIKMLGLDIALTKEFTHEIFVKIKMLGE